MSDRVRIFSDTDGARLAARLQKPPFGDRIEQRFLNAARAMETFFEQRIRFADLANQIRLLASRRIHHPRRASRRPLD